MELDKTEMASLDMVEVNPDTTQVKFEKSTFAQVVFHGVSETYPVDAHVVCKYTIQPLLKPTTSDWIGLYKVGWKSTRDYTYFHWVVLPSNQGGVREVDGNVLYQSHCLPKDDGEFYQFCYVTSSGHVRGASTPFQFKKPGADDFVTVEDEETDMLVVTSRTIALENDLTHALADKEKLKKANETLETTQDDLLLKLSDLSKQHNGEKETGDGLRKETKELTEKVEIMSSEAKDMVQAQDSLREKIKFISKEKDEILKRLEENEIYIKALQDKIKCLLSEKDSLTGRQKMLEEEKELYKSHFTSSEGTIQSYMKEIDNLKQTVKHQDDGKIKQDQKISSLETQLDSEKKRMSRQLCVSDTDKEHMQHLNEKLKNSEDKLCAVEHCKKMLNEEVLAVRAAHDKMAQTLERARSEAHNLKSQVARLEEDSKTETTTLKSEITKIQKENDDLIVTIATLQEKIKELEEKCQENEMLRTEEENGALYALKTAQLHLEKKLARGRKQTDDLRGQMEESIKTQRLQQQVEQDLLREISDLKERLSMGAEEYRMKYLECRRLQQELKKMRKHSSKTPPSTPEHPSMVEKEFVQTSANSSPERSRRESCTQVDLETVDFELQTQLEDLGKDFEACLARKQRYKHMLQEQKEKREALTKQHGEEIKKYKDQLEVSQKQMIDLKSDYDRKVNSLEEMVEKQRLEIAKFKERKEDVAKPKTEFSRLEHIYPNPYITNVGPIAASPMPIYVYGNPYAHLVKVEQNHPEAPAPGKLPYPNFGQTGASGSCESLERLPLDDEVETVRQLDAPLKPLPPPMNPEVLPSAKLAAIRAATSPLSQEEEAAPLHALLEEQDGEEERFQDAAGDPQKICPVCFTTFATDHPQSIFEDHVQSHYGPICPVCNKQYDLDYPMSKFEEHVQTHFEA